MDVRGLVIDFPAEAVDPERIREFLAQLLVAPFPVNDQMAVDLDIAQAIGGRPIGSC